MVPDSGCFGGGQYMDGNISGEPFLDGTISGFYYGCESALADCRCTFDVWLYLF